MNTLLASRRFRLCTICSILVILAVSAGCVSRYKLDLYLVRGEKKQEIDVERTEFIRDAVLNTPTERERVLKGSGNCVIVHTGTRGETVVDSKDNLMQWDKYLRFDILVQLPSRVEPDTLRLANNAYVHLIGEYDRDPADRVFPAREGSIVIDSIPNDFLYATIDGTFVNPKSDTVAFRGSFRVRASR